MADIQDTVAASEFEGYKEIDTTQDYDPNRDYDVEPFNPELDLGETDIKTVPKSYGNGRTLTPEEEKYKNAANANLARTSVVLAERKIYDPQNDPRVRLPKTAFYESTLNLGSINNTVGERRNFRKSIYDYSVGNNALLDKRDKFTNQELVSKYIDAYGETKDISDLSTWDKIKNPLQVAREGIEGGFREKTLSDGSLYATQMNGEEPNEFTETLNPLFDQQSKTSGQGVMGYLGTSLLRAVPNTIFDTFRGASDMVAEVSKIVGVDSSYNVFNGLSNSFKSLNQASPENTTISEDITDLGTSTLVQIVQAIGTGKFISKLPAANKSNIMGKVLREAPLFTMYLSTGSAAKEMANTYGLDDTESFMLYMGILSTTYLGGRQMEKFINKNVFKQVKSLTAKSFDDYLAKGVNIGELKKDPAKAGQGIGKFFMKNLEKLKKSESVGEGFSESGGEVYEIIPELLGRIASDYDLENNPLVPQEAKDYLKSYTDNQLSADNLMKQVVMSAGGGFLGGVSGPFIGRKLFGIKKDDNVDEKLLDYIVDGRFDEVETAFNKLRKSGDITMAPKNIGFNKSSLESKNFDAGLFQTYDPAGDNQNFLSLNDYLLDKAWAQLKVINDTYQSNEFQTFIDLASVNMDDKYIKSFRQNSTKAMLENDFNMAEVKKALNESVKSQLQIKDIEEDNTIVDPMSKKRRIDVIKGKMRNSLISSLDLIHSFNPAASLMKNVITPTIFRKSSSKITAQSNLGPAIVRGLILSQGQVAQKYKRETSESNKAIEEDILATYYDELQTLLDIDRANGIDLGLVKEKDALLQEDEELDTEDPNLDPTDPANLDTLNELKAKKAADRDSAIKGRSAARALKSLVDSNIVSSIDWETVSNNLDGKNSATEDINSVQDAINYVVASLSFNAEQEGKPLSEKDIKTIRDLLGIVLTNENYNTEKQLAKGVRAIQNKVAKYKDKATIEQELKALFENRFLNSPLKISLGKINKTDSTQKRKSTWQRANVKRNQGTTKVRSKTIYGYRAGETSFEQLLQNLFDDFNANQDSFDRISEINDLLDNLDVMANYLLQAGIGTRTMRKTRESLDPTFINNMFGMGTPEERRAKIRSYPTLSKNEKDADAKFIKLLKQQSRQTKTLEISDTGTFKDAYLPEMSDDFISNNLNQLAFFKERATILKEAVLSANINPDTVIAKSDIEVLEEQHLIFKDIIANLGSFVNLDDDEFRKAISELAGYVQTLGDALDNVDLKDTTTVDKATKAYYMLSGEMHTKLAKYREVILNAVNLHPMLSYTGRLAKVTKFDDVGPDPYIKKGYDSFLTAQNFLGEPMAFARYWNSPYTLSKQYTENFNEQALGNNTEGYPIKQEIVIEKGKYESVPEGDVASGPSVGFDVKENITVNWNMLMNREVFNTLNSILSYSPSELVAKIAVIDEVELVGLGVFKLQKPKVTRSYGKGKGKGKETKTYTTAAAKDLNEDKSNKKVRTLAQLRAVHQLLAAKTNPYTYVHQDIDYYLSSFVYSAPTKQSIDGSDVLVSNKKFIGKYTFTTSVIRIDGTAGTGKTSEVIGLFSSIADIDDRIFKAGTKATMTSYLEDVANTSQELGFYFDHLFKGQVEGKAINLFEWTLPPSNIVLNTKASAKFYVPQNSKLKDKAFEVLKRLGIDKPEVGTNYFMIVSDEGKITVAKTPASLNRTSEASTDAPNSIRYTSPQDTNRERLKSLYGEASVITIESSTSERPDTVKKDNKEILIVDEYLLSNFIKPTTTITAANRAGEASLSKEDLTKLFQNHESEYKKSLEELKYLEMLFSSEGLERNNRMVILVGDRFQISKSGLTGDVFSTLATATPLKTKFRSNSIDIGLFNDYLVTKQQQLEYGAQVSKLPSTGSISTLIDNDLYNVNELFTSNYYRGLDADGKPFVRGVEFMTSFQDLKTSKWPELADGERPKMILAPGGNVTEDQLNKVKAQFPSWDVITVEDAQGFEYEYGVVIVGNMDASTTTYKDQIKRVKSAYTAISRFKNYVGVITLSGNEFETGDTESLIKPDATKVYRSRKVGSPQEVKIAGNRNLAATRAKERALSYYDTFRAMTSSPITTAGSPSTEPAKESSAPNEATIDNSVGDPSGLNTQEEVRTFLTDTFINGNYLGKVNLTNITPFTVTRDVDKWVVSGVTMGPANYESNSDLLEAIKNITTVYVDRDGKVMVPYEVEGSTDGIKTVELGDIDVTFIQGKKFGC